MKLRNFIYSLSVVALASTFSACESEKDLIIIDGDLPIKTSTLYMVGDATPNGWSIDTPTPLSASEEDPLVFEWEGNLNSGEMKLCLVPGSWDQGFIRPISNGEEIGKDPITDARFQMHAGDPDEKWSIVEAGVYSLTFNLRNWTMSSRYLRGQDAPVKEPLVAEMVYMVGSATPAGWNIDTPTEMEKKSDFIFEYNGPLEVGEMKAYIETGNWNASAIRPVSDGCRISKSGVESDEFVFAASPDNKWRVEEAGLYRVTFNLRDWTIAVESTGDFKPIPKLYMIGEATDGGWSWDNATVIEATADNDKIFVWTGELGRGTFKAAEEKDFGASFYRPAGPNCEVNASGVADLKMVFTTDPDDQWMVTVVGKYTLTFNTEDMTFNAVYHGEGASFPKLYMVGDATPNGWSLDDATAIETEVENLYVWEGQLKEGEMKACFERDWGASFYRPAGADYTISENGVNAPYMQYSSGDPDYKWTVTRAGNYRLSFDLTHLELKAEYLD